MLQLERPLVAIDLETTGTDIATAKIVQVGLIRVAPEDQGKQVSRVTWEQLINPGILIPKEAIEVHGITDADVQGKPFFHEVAPQLLQLLNGADLLGYSMIDFDLPILEAEFARTPVPFSREGRCLVDPLRIFRQQVPHTLEGACKFYCHAEHTSAHNALADAKATLEVLSRQILQHSLPETISELAKQCIPEDYATSCGKLRFNKEGEVVLGFGKHVGKKLSTVPPDYLQWILMKDFSAEVKKLCEQALHQHMEFEDSLNRRGF